MSTKYEVGIFYCGLSNYLVEAESEEEAQTKARTRYRAGDNGEALGNEFEDIDRMTVAEAGDEGEDGDEGDDGDGGEDGDETIRHRVDQARKVLRGEILAAFKAVKKPGVDEEGGCDDPLCGSCYIQPEDKAS